MEGEMFHAAKVIAEALREVKKSIDTLDTTIEAIGNATAIREDVASEQMAQIARDGVTDIMGAISQIEFSL